MATVASYLHGELLTFSREERSEAILIRPSGEVDLSTVPMLWANLNALFEDGHHVVVDLSGILYIDSAGLEALSDSCQVFRQRGQRFALARPARAIGRLMDILSLDKAIPIFASVETALASFRLAPAYRINNGGSTPSVDAYSKDRSRDDKDASPHSGGGETLE